MPASTWGWRLHRASFPSNTTQNSRPRPHEKLATRPSKIRDSSPCLTFRAKREQHYPESPFRRAAPARFEAQHPLRRIPPVAKRTQSVKVVPILRGGEAPMRFRQFVVGFLAVLSFCLTRSAWSQLTYTIPVVDKSDPGSPLKISGTASFT